MRWQTHFAVPSTGIFTTAGENEMPLMLTLASPPEVA